MTPSLYTFPGFKCCTCYPGFLSSSLVLLIHFLSSLLPFRLYPVLLPFLPHRSGQNANDWDTQVSSQLPPSVFNAYFPPVSPSSSSQETTPDTEERFLCRPRHHRLTSSSPIPPSPCPSPQSQTRHPPRPTPPLPAITSTYHNSSQLTYYHGRIPQNQITITNTSLSQHHHHPKPL